MKNKHFVYTLLFACILINTNLINSATLPIDTAKVCPIVSNKEVGTAIEITSLQTNEEEHNGTSNNLLSVSDGVSSAQVSIKNITDFFYGNHTELFSPSPNDQVFSAKSNWDLTFEGIVSKWLKFKATARTRAGWGNETSVMPVTGSSIKLGDAVVGEHTHFVARMVPWIREAWVDFSLNKTFNLDSSLQHKVKVGAFPFVLGRGISLGSAYSAIPGFLGFCASSAIDQFVFGQLLAGDLIPGRVTYNLYSAILENFSDKFGRVNTIIYESEVGHHGSPVRGFGKINFILAADLKCKILDGTGNFGILEAEPYVVYNKAPEQRIEFTADSSSNLATFGLCMDYTGSDFEWGFDTAFNIGAQDVLAWDRNQITMVVNDDGIYQEQYTFVKTGSADGDQAVVTKGAKTIVMGSGSGQGVQLNGMEIGVDTTVTPNVTYYNDVNRFRAGYKNKYKGFMFVADGYWNILPEYKFKLAGTVGWATGDENPNRNLNNPTDSEVDGDYQGFIGLQEIYSGKRVLSFFLLGPNNIARPLSSPSFTNKGSARTAGYATNINGFTNLFFIGNGFDWATKFFGKGLRVKSYVLSYWQDKATRKYDAINQMSLDQWASTHLGVEWNVTLRLAMIGDLTGFVQAGVFVPGQHYIDIKGKPLNPVQLKALNSLDSTGYPANGVPVIGDTTAVAINWGLEFVF